MDDKQLIRNPEASQILEGVITALLESESHLAQAEILQAHTRALEANPTLRLLMQRDGTNRFFSLDDLPFSDDEKVFVLEWFARKLWVILEEGSGDPDYYGKSYDPLTIDREKGVAHSYVFNLSEVGGRHHPFESLLDLEALLVQAGITRIKEMLAAQG